MKSDRTFHSATDRRTPAPDVMPFRDLCYGRGAADDLTLTTKIADAPSLVPPRAHRRNTRLGAGLVRLA
jgi:hypothetical protein